MITKIVGTGLIGTSIALAIKQRGDTVLLEDINTEHLHVARDLLSIVQLGDRGDLVNDATRIDLVVIATPSSFVLQELLAQFESNPESMFIEISGLKSELLLQIEKFPELAKRFCATHPMAGRELSGPTSARADLFEGATWIITPTGETRQEVTDVAIKLASDLGARVQVVDANRHDKAISAVSHVPQLISTILARSLENLSAEDLSLAGQGLRDLTRLAESNPDLWAELLLSNKANVVEDLGEIQSQIAFAIALLEEGVPEKVAEFIERGRIEKARIPGKHGGKTRDYVYLPIVIEDKAGQLAAIFDECAEVKVNVEDLFIEHSPGQETGLITLALSQDDANILFPHLVKQNWRVHGIRANR